jgi:hypothetical protein
MAEGDRVFEFRLHSVHAGADNQLVALSCQRRVEEDAAAGSGPQWRPFALHMTGPPFAMFGYTAFICQLSYLRMNAAERGLQVARVRGQFRMVASAEWAVQEIAAAFWMRLAGDRPASGLDDALAYIQERMRDCPISRNLTAARKQTQLHVE